jgi:peptidoglycan/xylan/chitin deacetylase (PgdA/CDA1 family)
MRAISLMYHDVVSRDQRDSSGFPGADAALYKIAPDQFRNHIQSIRRATQNRPQTAPDLSSLAHRGTRFFITFDDGGISAFTTIAGILEEAGCRGLFFVTAGRVGQRSFMTPDQIRELRGRGHIIGSHSLSHPLRMSRCSWNEMIEEWSVSVKILSEILGERVRVASVPGGHYSKQVAQSAAQSGINTLFTSEPTASPKVVDGCTVLGRYVIRRWTSPETAAAIAAGKLAPRWRQSIFWNAKKALKAMGGNYYSKARTSELVSLVEKASGESG